MINPTGFDAAEQLLRTRGIVTDDALRWTVAVGTVQMLIRRTFGQA